MAPGTSLSVSKAESRIWRDSFRELFDQRVIGALALAPRLDEADAAQMREVRRDARLAEVEDFLQFRDGEFLFLE